MLSTGAQPLARALQGFPDDGRVADVIGEKQDDAQIEPVAILFGEVEAKFLAM